MFNHFITNTRRTTCFVVEKLANSRDNFFLSKVRQGVGVPIGVDICFGAVFRFLVGLEDIIINVTMSSPVIKMLLDV